MTKDIGDVVAEMVSYSAKLKRGKSVEVPSGD